MPVECSRGERAQACQEAGGQAGACRQASGHPCLPAHLPALLFPVSVSHSAHLPGPAPTCLQEDFEMSVAKVMKKDTDKNMSIKKLWK